MMATYFNLMSSAGEWRLILMGIFAIGYFFINWGTRKKLIKGLENDSRIAGRLPDGETADVSQGGARFVAVKIALPHEAPSAKAGLGCLWVGVPLALLGVFLCFSDSRSTRGTAVFLLIVGLLIVAYVAFLRWQNARHDPAVEADIMPDRLELRRFSGATTIFVYGPTAAFEISFEEVVRTVGLGAQELQGFKYSAMVTDGKERVTIPLSFDGAGEFLGLCRHMGSHVVFSSSCPSWFKAKLEALPSWQPGYFDQSAGS